MEKVLKNSPQPSNFLGTEAKGGAKTLPPPQFKLNSGGPGAPNAGAGGATAQLQPAAAAPEVQAAPTQLSLLDAALDKWNVPEDDVIAICGKLNAIEKIVLMTTPSYRAKMVSALNGSEMIRAIAGLGFPLSMQLDWIEAAAVATSMISYSDIKRLITSASQPERDALKSTHWQAFFVNVCTNATMIEALVDLKFDIGTALQWLSAEGINITGAGGDFFANLEAADDATLASLRSDNTAIDALYRLLSDADFARLAATVILVAPGTCVDRDGARKAAWTMLRVQLANKDIARTTLKGSLTPVIIPRNLLLTDVAQFSALAGTKTFDGRAWEPTRGVGYGIYVAMAEENLLGGACTAKFNGATVNGTYAEGYSTASHEFAHGMHDNVLTAADRKTITDAYDARKVLAKAAPTDVDQWVDGKEGCYASQTDHEFFAQLSNAYLGTNTGLDPNTNDARHNGKDWVKNHEATVFALLDRMYGGGSVANANPKTP